MRQAGCKSDQMRPGIFSDLFESELLKIEVRGHHKASFAKQDFDEFTELKVVEATILLAPQSWNGGWTDLDLTILFHGEMDSEERISQIGHRINIRAKCTRWLIRVEVKSFERKDAISFRETEIQGNLVGIKPSGIDNMICAETFSWRHYH